MQKDISAQELIQIEIMRLDYIIRYGRFTALDKGRLMQNKMNLKRKEVCNG